MSTRKKIFAGMGALIGVLILIFVGSNCWDSELSPEAKVLLETKYEVPPEAAAGFQALNAIPDNRERLEKEYCPGSYVCTAAELKDKQSEIQGLMKKNETAFRLFDDVISKGVYGRDPGVNPNGLRIFSFLMTYRLRALQLNQLLLQNKDDLVLRTLVNVNRFAANSLSYPVPVIEASVLQLMLKQNRSFLTDAVKKFPRLKGRITPDMLKTFSVNLEWKAFSELVLHAEAAIGAFQLERLMSGYPAQQSRASSSTPLQDFVSRLVTKKNRTLNLYVSTIRPMAEETCVRDGISCPEPLRMAYKPTDIANPGGKIFVRMWFLSLDRQLKALYANARIVAEPLKL